MWKSAGWGWGSVFHDSLRKKQNKNRNAAHVYSVQTVTRPLSETPHGKPVRLWKALLAEQPVQQSMLLRAAKNNKHTGWLGKCQQQGQQFCICHNYGRHLSPKSSRTRSLQWLDKSFSFVVQFEISVSVHRCTKQGADFTALVKARQPSCQNPSTSSISLINSLKPWEKILEVSPSKSPFFFDPFSEIQTARFAVNLFFFFFFTLRSTRATRLCNKKM